MCTFLLALWLGADALRSRRLDAPRRFRARGRRSATSLGPRSSSCRAHSRSPDLAALVRSLARPLWVAACALSSASSAVAFLVWSGRTPSSRARSPRSSPCGSRRLAWAQIKCTVRKVPPAASPRARRPALGFLSQGRRRANPDATARHRHRRPHPRQWWEELCWLFAVMTRLGHRPRSLHSWPLPRSRPGATELGRRKLFAHLSPSFSSSVLVRHSVLLGYLSGRHIMPLVYVSLPWAAAGSFRLRTRNRRQAPLDRKVGRRAAILAGWSHRRGFDRGADAAEPSESSEPLGSLGGRTLAAGHAGRRRARARHPRLGPVRLRPPGYDYWHVRQALTDSHLAYVVVGDDELRRPSRRGETLRAVLAYAANRSRRSPNGERPGARRGGWVYRYRGPRRGRGCAHEPRVVLATPRPRHALDLARPSGTAPPCRPTSTRP